MPFSFVLPDTVFPSTSYKKLGSIKYYLKAKMHTKSQGFMDSAKKAFSGGFKTTQPLHIRGTLDNATLSSLNVETKFRESKTFTFSRSSGPLSMHGKIPRAIAVPGEFLPIKTHVKNDSGKRVSGVRATLIEHCKFTAKSHGETASASKKAVLQKFERTFDSEITGGQALDDVMVELLVPQDAEPSLKGKLFSRHHRVSVCLYFVSLVLIILPG